MSLALRFTLYFILASILTLLIYVFSQVTTSNDEIIDQVQKCQEAGLDFTVFRSKYDDRIMSIECNPELDKL